MIGGRLRATFGADDFAAAAAFVARIAEAADAANHHPDVLLRWGEVAVTTVSHDAGGLTQRDVDLAGTISALADELGLTGKAAEVETRRDRDRCDRHPGGPAVLAGGARLRRGPAGDDSDSSTPPGSGRRSGSSRWTSRGRSATGSTSTSWCRTTRPRRGWPRRSPPAGTWSATTRAAVLGARRRGGQRGLRLHLAGARPQLNGRPKAPDRSGGGRSGAFGVRGTSGRGRGATGRQRERPARREALGDHGPHRREGAGAVAAAVVRQHDLAGLHRGAQVRR